MRIEVVESPLPGEGEIKESGDGTNGNKKESVQTEGLKKDTSPKNGGNIISLADVRARNKKS